MLYRPIFFVLLLIGLGACRAASMSASRDLAAIDIRFNELSVDGFTDEDLLELEDLVGSLRESVPDHDAQFSAAALLLEACRSGGSYECARTVRERTIQTLLIDHTLTQSEAEILTLILSPMGRQTPLLVV